MINLGDQDEGSDLRSTLKGQLIKVLQGFEGPFFVVYLGVCGFEKVGASNVRKNKLGCMLD